MDYESLKQLAKENGVRPQDLIALACQNDPFYTGSPGELEKAEWFAGLWRRFGYSRGVHLRRIHYQVVSQNPPEIKPNGTVYENTLNDWDYLNLAAKYARYLRLVPAEAFVDRRNPEALIYARYGDFNEDPTPGWVVERYEDWTGYALPELPALPDLPDLPTLPDYRIDGYWGIQQRYHVEVWAEKTTMNDILTPLCQACGVNLITGAGELSITAVLALMERVRDADRPARILYISDFDPAGLGMPISVARKIEFFQREFGYDDLQICLEPVVLTSDQVSEFDLPRVPVKDSDKRKARWVETQGEGQVELDALEALYPGELERIVRQAIYQYHDPQLQDRALDVRRRLRWALAEGHDEVREAWAGDLDEVNEAYSELRANWAATRARFAELVAAFQPEIDAHRARLEEIVARASEIYDGVADSLDERDVDAADYPLPEPDLPEQPDTLYDSNRGYFDQLAYYKEHRGLEVADV